MVTFGQRLRRAREAQGLTQEAVATHLGVARVNVTNWEGDAHMPASKRIAPLAEFLNVSEEWLLSNRGDPPKSSSHSKIQEAEMLLRRLPPEELERELAYLRSLTDR